jgi:hypothetical protein
MAAVRRVVGVTVTTASRIGLVLTELDGWRDSR